MHYIDYHTYTTDDETPEGNDAQAFEVFTQFLKDYPQSDRRPAVLLRLAAIVQRGLQGPYNNQSGQDQLASYLEIYARDYPDSAAQSAVYKSMAAGVKTKVWDSRWQFRVIMDKPVYKVTDTIRVNLQFYNRSRTAQILDTTFLNHWTTSLHMNLSQAREQGCEDRSGDFPLIREKPRIESGPVTVLPGDYYGETFILGHTSDVKGYGLKIFMLASGGKYLHFMAYQHPVLKWIFLREPNGGNFTIE